jgi:hypothetical protein
MDYLPAEVIGMIIQYASNSILQDLRQSDSEIPYTTRLCQYLRLRLVSRTFDIVLSQQQYEGQTFEILLRRKQLEKLDIVLEAMRMTADLPPVNSRLSVPKLKRLCGKFWHNPDLTATTVSAIASILFVPQNLNFAVKLEPWILHHQKRSEGSTASSDGLLIFEFGDWVIYHGGLSIRRVSRWNSTPKSRMGTYLNYESGQIRNPSLPEGTIDPVQARLGHRRRWYIEYVTAHGTHSLRCLVNFETHLVWDNIEGQLYGFDGRQYNFNDLPESATDDDSDGSGDSDNDSAEE